MTQERKRGWGICAYCGQVRKTTPDHIPPRNLFAPPRARLITVPICDVCNEGTSKDDEYLRVALALRSETRAHPSMVKLLPHIQRGLGRSEAAAFANALKQSLYQRITGNPGGVIERATFHKVDFWAISRVLERITRGLYFYNTLQPLPKEYGVLVLPDDVPHGLDDVRDQLLSMPRLEIGRGEFGYRGAIWLPQQENEGLGLVVAVYMTFYGGLSFLTVAGKGTAMDAVMTLTQAERTRHGFRSSQ